MTGGPPPGGHGDPAQRLSVRVQVSQRGGAQRGGGQGVGPGPRDRQRMNRIVRAGRHADGDGDPAQGGQCRCRAARGDPQGHRQTTSLPPPGPVQFAGQPGRRIGGDAGQGDVQSVGIDGVRTGQRGGGGQCGVTVGTSPGITAGIAGPGRHRQQQAGAAVRMKEGPFGRQMRAERDAAGQHRAIRSGGVQIRRLEASGGVTITQPGQTARGQFAIYDVDRKIVTMIGNVSLVRNDARVQGGRLVLEMDTGRAVLDGGAAGAPGQRASGGRVSGRFTVPQTQSRQAPPAGNTTGH